MTKAQLVRGDYIRIRSTQGGEWCDAFVGLASEKQPSSVMLFLSGCVRAQHGIVTGALPLVIDYDAGTVTSLLGDEYEIEVVQDARH